MKLTLFVALAAGLFSAETEAAQKASAYLNKPDGWFASAEAQKVAENILSWQSDRGDWPKNTGTASEPCSGDRAKVKGTVDNGATVPGLQFLARAFAATKTPAYEYAFLKGFDHVLAA